jgi:peptide deformylase
MGAMAVSPDELKIVIYPHSSLRRKAGPIEETDGAVRAVARKMLQLMHDADGVGLAAPQVDLPWRLFVTNARDADPVDRVYINPQLTMERGELEAMAEGCLSLPGVTVDVRRPPKMTVRATDLEGDEFEVTDDEFLSRVCQHEFDHLNGVLIIDKMSPMDRLATRKTLKELKAQAMVL